MNIGTMNIDNLLLSITQEEAFQLYHELCKKFGWAGTFMTIQDIRETAERYRDCCDLPPLSELDEERLVDGVLASREWRKDIAQIMSTEADSLLWLAISEWHDENSKEETNVSV
jgi:hypothetical protein